MLTFQHGDSNLNHEFFRSEAHSLQGPSSVLSTSVDQDGHEGFGTGAASNGLKGSHQTRPAMDVRSQVGKIPISEQDPQVCSLCSHFVRGTQ